MKEIKLRAYLYRCKCGYELKVFLDSGIPSDAWKCRGCGGTIQRREC